MARKTLGIMAVCGLVWLCGDVRPASAQSLFDPFGCCAPPPSCCQQAPACVQVMPQYTQVPVTEMREVKQTVMRPVTETKYVDQTVTEMRPVVENRTVQVPTVSYQTVTENQTRMCDAGRWVTSYKCRPQMSPCQYDNRPGLFGWMNRSAYQVRSSLTPKVIAERNYVPNMVAQVIPVTRQVAVNSVQERTIQVTKMIPHTSTRKVAVNTTRMVAEEITTKQPVTVMQTVPTAVAYGFGSQYGTATAIAPTPLTTQRPVPQRTATIRDQGETFLEKEKASKDTDTRTNSIQDPGRKALENEEPAPTTATEDPVLSHKAPSAARVGRWVAARRVTAPTTSEGGVDVADAGKPKNR